MKRGFGIEFEHANGVEGEEPPPCMKCFATHTLTNGITHIIPKIMFQ